MFLYTRFTLQINVVSNSKRLKRDKLSQLEREDSVKLIKNTRGAFGIVLLKRRA